MPRPPVEAHWPTGGLNRRYAIQNQPPYTTADCLNVRARSSLADDGRERGGSRPGFGKAFSTQLGGGTPVRLVNSIREVFSANGISLTDDFVGTALSTAWSDMPWTGTFNGDNTGPLLPSQLVGGRVLSSTLGGTAPNWAIQAVVRELVDLDSTQAYSVSLDVAVASEIGGEYFLFARMTDASPNVQMSGVAAHLTLGALNLSTGEKPMSGSLIAVVGGVLTSYTFTPSIFLPAYSPFTFTLAVNGSTVTASVNGSTLATQDVSSLSIPAGRRVGFGVRSAELDNLTARVESFEMIYFPGGNMVINRPRLLASAGGILYRQTSGSAMAAVTDDDNLDLASDVFLSSAERLGNLYIADHTIRVSGVDGEVKNIQLNTSFDFESAGSGDLTTVASVDDVLWIYAATDADDVGYWYITAVTATTITVAANPTAAISALTGASFRVIRGPKVYASAGNTLRAWTATAGSMPIGCKLVARYKDRMFLANTIEAPHAWFCSRQGTPTDFDYTTTDSRRATSSANSDAGAFGEPVTALIPYHDDYLIFGCPTSLWILRGDPTFGGRIDNLHRTIGCLSATSWCYAPGGELFILGRDGLFVFSSGSGGFAESVSRSSVSRERLPAELLRLDPNTYSITMCYDTLGRGLHVQATPVSETEGVRHWWVDWQTIGFWPLSLPTSMEAITGIYYDSDDTTETAAVFGCRDGYLRRFSEDNGTDDGTSFIDNSYCLFGPFLLGDNSMMDGVMDTLTGVVALNSGSVTWSLQVGKTPEEALNADPVASGTWTPGINKLVRPRCRGKYAYVRISGITDAWTIEPFIATRRPFGMQRISA